ncbi:MAG: glycosyltransferase family 39 protein [Planctomycetaceae bacterium]|nr:glycosyltransferase family 39 protein [Planctomycetaceae bacterium]
MSMIIANRTLRDIAALLGAGLIVWGYLAASTVMISEDGVLYIERAQKVWSEHETIFNLREPPGFPILIAGVHKLLSVFGDDGLHTWIRAGQLTTMACGLAALAMLYLLGRALLDRRSAFWGVLILTLLPYPAHFAVDVLRDWPHLLFLSAGLLLLYRAVEAEKGMLFFLAGLSSGIGYVIRPECAQLLLYGAVFFVIEFVQVLRRRRAAASIWHYIWMAAGFLLVFLPLAAQLDSIIPYKLNQLFQTPHRAFMTIPVYGDSAEVAAFGPGGFGRALTDLFERLCEDLFYFFAIPAAIGFYLLYSKTSAERHKRLLLGMVIGFYTAALLLLDMRWGYISRRHLLPLTALACFCIPAGAQWLGSRLHRKNARAGFYCVIVAGLAIGAAKLLRPPGYERKYCFEAIVWLSRNTAADDVLYTFDRRLAFYAQRPYCLYKRIPKRPVVPFNYLLATSPDALPARIAASVELCERFPLKGAKELLVYRQLDH